MAQSQASFFRDDPAVALRTPEVPDADWDAGMNYGSCNPGVGISTENPDLVVDDSGNGNWSLNDQFEDPRTPQIGQLLGGPGYSDPSTSSGQEGTLPDNVIRLADEALLTGDGDAATGSTGNATLATLSAGWSSV